MEGVAVADGFDLCAGASVPTLTMFPLPAHRTYGVDFPHWALLRHHDFAHGKSCLVPPVDVPNRGTATVGHPGSAQLSPASPGACGLSNGAPGGAASPVPPPPFLAAGRGSLRIRMRRPLELPNRNRRRLPAGTTVVGRLCPALRCRALARGTIFQLCSNIPTWDDSVAKKAYGWSGTFQRNLRAIESKAASNSESSLA